MRGREEANESTSRWSRHDWWGVVLEAPDAHALGSFYAQLLGWELSKDELGDAAVAPPEGVAYIGFQTSPTYVRPVWPPVEGAPQMTMHLDFEVSELEAAVAQAIELGARAGRAPATRQRPGASRPGGASILPLHRRLARAAATRPPLRKPRKRGGRCLSVACAPREGSVCHVYVARVGRGRVGRRRTRRARSWARGGALGSGMTSGLRSVTGHSVVQPVRNSTRTTPAEDSS